MNDGFGWTMFVLGFGACLIFTVVGNAVDNWKMQRHRRHVKSVPAGYMKKRMISSVWYRKG